MVNKKFKTKYMKKKWYLVLALLLDNSTQEFLVKAKNKKKVKVRLSKIHKIYQIQKMGLFKKDLISVNNITFVKMDPGTVAGHSNMSTESMGNAE